MVRVRGPLDGVVDPLGDTELLNVIVEESDDVSSVAGLESTAVTSRRTVTCAYVTPGLTGADGARLLLSAQRSSSNVVSSVPADGGVLPGPRLSSRRRIASSRSLIVRVTRTGGVDSPALEALLLLAAGLVGPGRSDEARWARSWGGGEGGRVAARLDPPQLFTGRLVAPFIARRCLVAAGEMTPS